MTTVFNHILGATHEQGVELGYNNLRLLYRAAMKRDWSSIGDDTFRTLFLDEVDKGNERAKELHHRLPSGVTISSVVNQMPVGRIEKYLELQSIGQGHVNSFVRAFDDNPVGEVDRTTPDGDDLEQIRAGWRPPSASVKLAWANEQDELPDVDGVNQTALDAVLTSFGVPVYSEIKQKLAAMGEAVKAAESRLPTGGLTITLGEAKPERKWQASPTARRFP